MYKPTKEKGYPWKNKEIKLIPIGNALSKEIPLKVNGFAETRNFLHLQCFVETDHIKSQWVCQNKEFPTPVSCLKTFPGYLG